MNIVKSIILFVGFITINVNCDQEYVSDNDVNDDISVNYENSKDGLDATKLWNLFQNYIDENSNLNYNQLFEYTLKRLKEIHENYFLNGEIKQYDDKSNGFVLYQDYFIKTFGNDLYQIDIKNEIIENPDEMNFIYNYEKSRWLFINNETESLNYSDFYKFLYPNEYENVHLNDSSYIFKLYDLNSDNQWSYDEYVKAININNGFLLIDDFKHILNIEKREFLSRVDLDSNNLIDFYEFSQWNMPSLNETVTVIVDEIFEICDLNNDLLLSKNEVLPNVDLFASYEFTNYGFDFRTEMLENSNVHNEF